MTAPKDAMRVFESWAAAQQDFTAQTTDFYRLLWEGWLGALPRGTDWKKATRLDLLKFLDSAAPGHGRPPKDPAKMAAATRYRYYRVLRGVYKSAVEAKLVPEDRDPTLLGFETPAQTPETRIGQVLPPGVLARLRDPQALCELVPGVSREDWLPLRDRALVALLAHCAPSVSELAALRGADLRQGGRPLEPLRQSAVSGVEPVPIWLQITGDAERSLQVPAAIAPLLQQWLLAREELLKRHAMRMLGQADRQAIPTAAEASLFPSRQVSDPGAPLPPLDERIIYRAVRRHVQAALERSSSGQDARGKKLRVALGPQIVRNSVIADWLAAGLDGSAVAALAGVKASSSLRVSALAAGIAPVHRSRRRAGADRS